MIKYIAVVLFVFGFCFQSNAQTTFSLSELYKIRQMDSFDNIDAYIANKNWFPLKSESDGSVMRHMWMTERYDHTILWVLFRVIPEGMETNPSQNQVRYHFLDNQIFADITRDLVDQGFGITMEKENKDFTREYQYRKGKIGVIITVNKKRKLPYEFMLFILP